MVDSLLPVGGKLLMGTSWIPSEKREMKNLGKKNCDQQCSLLECPRSPVCGLIGPCSLS